MMSLTTSAGAWDLKHISIKCIDVQKNEMSCGMKNAEKSVQQSQNNNLNKAEKQNFSDHSEICIQQKTSNKHEDRQSTYQNDQKETEIQPHCDIFNGNDLEQQTFLERHLASVRPKVPTTHIPVQWPVKQSSHNYWRRLVDLEICGNVLKGGIYPRSIPKHYRFAQAKKSLNHVCSYFSARILKCCEKSGISIGLSRRDFPNTSKLGHVLGSVSYSADTGHITSPHSGIITGPTYSKGDIIGCGIVFPPHYRRYTDLSTDDSSDGMTDVVLSSLLNVNKKSMDFVRNILMLNIHDSDSSEDENFKANKLPNNRRKAEKHSTEETDYYNENYIESRTEIEVYFTHNMNIVGKLSMHVPIGGFYPTVLVSSNGTVKMEFDFS